MARRWRYVVPNLLTCVSLVAGMLAMAEAVAGRFEAAAWWIVLCVLLDKADGTAARLLGASSAFGGHLDSLCDAVVFGAAPAVLVLARLRGPHRPPWMAGHPAMDALVLTGAVLFAVCTLLRLARFGVAEDDRRHFAGVPTTGAGGVVATYYLTAVDYHLPWQAMAALPALMGGLGLLMVSSLPVPKVSFGRSRALNVLIGVNLAAGYACGILRVFPEYLLGLVTLYLLVGSTAVLLRRSRRDGAHPGKAGSAA